MLVFAVAATLVPALALTVVSSRKSQGSIGDQIAQERLSSLRTSDALVGDPYWDTGLGKAAIGLAVPIRQPDGRYVGALMAKLNLRAVADLLQRLAPRAAAGGDLYVMTDQ